MKRVLKFVGTLISVLSVSLGSVIVVLAQNTAVHNKKVETVDPYMAIAMAVIAGVIGIIAFIKRNRTK